MKLLPVAVCVCDAAGRITFFNQQAADLWGREPRLNHSKDKFSGAVQTFRPDGQALPPEKTPMAIAVRDGCSIRDAESLIARPDGSRILVNACINPIRNRNGKLAGAVSVFYDVTARRDIVDKLRASESELRLISDNAPILLAHCDYARRFIFANRAYAERFGCKPADIVGRRLSEVMGQAAYETVRPYIDRVLAGETLDYELEVPYKGLGSRFMRVSYVPDLDERGFVKGWLAAMSDITERRRAEDALRASERRFRTLASHAGVGIFLTGAHGETVFVNESWCTITGLTPDKAAGAGWTQAIHPDDRKRVSLEWAAAVRAGESSNAEFRFLRHDGSIAWVQGSAVELRDSTGVLTGYIGTITDITQRKIAEISLKGSEERFRALTEQLRAAQEQLQAHANDLEQKVQERTASLQEAVVQMEEFSYSVSHDLRAPLRAMNAYAQALAEDYGPQLDATARAYLTRIQRNSQRMEKLTHDVLTYSRLARTEIRLTTINLASLFNDIIGQYTELQEPAATVHIIAPLHPVRAHETSLGQCLANLLTNAAKFVEPGAHPVIRVRTEERGDSIRIWIEDNGIGIKPEYQSSLFKIFERVPTPHAYDGTGIGLAIVRKAAEKMGGRCGVESDGETGSRFWIELAKG